MGLQGRLGKGSGGGLFPGQAKITGDPSFFPEKKRTPFARGLERRIDKEELILLNSNKTKACFSPLRKRQILNFSSSPTVLGFILDSRLCVPAFQQVCPF